MDFIFKVRELKPIVAWTLRKGQEFHKPFTKEAAGAHLWFVKDQGVYLMSGAVKKQLRHATPKGERFCVVAYAEGFGRDADYDKVCAAAGGDDFVEAIPVGEFVRLMKDGARLACVRLTETDIQVLPYTSPKVAEVVARASPAYTKRDLLIALENSLELQSFYAKLLNERDGGKRMQFKTMDSWMDRLVATGRLARKG